MNTFLHLKHELSQRRHIEAIFGDAAPTAAEIYQRGKLTLDQRIIYRGMREQIYSQRTPATARRRSVSNGNFWKFVTTNPF